MAAIYNIEGSLSELPPEERQRQRELTIKPMVEAFFAWVKKNKRFVLPKSETGKGFEYLLTEIPKHMEDKNLEFLDNLLPWSDKLPQECRKANR
ncbi:transposase [Clostridiaceae bacterium WCA-383-APC-5B]|uniref:Transposase n=1 Tax=Inconstantimicrobium porci TaxID=2652291 RepID=A0A7X2T2J1_9CLOT|nr:transposase [Inconstantimicrobium porci]